MSSKRPRAASPPSFTLSPSPEPEPTPKAARTIPLPSDASSSSVPLLCTLPPTCHNHPTPLANTSELESHYATYHAHVCEERSCRCVFPDARLLELHQTECHDPLAAVRKERGEKIFACHISTCPRAFLTPKARRLHLIQAHGYPKEYFFAVTNKGVGGLLKWWGEGASMIRGEWKPRENEAAVESGSEGRSEDGEAQDMDSDGEEPVHETLVRTQHQQQAENGAKGKQVAELGAGLDTLTDRLDALSLVPPAVRFGRGARGGGFSHRRGGSGHEHGAGASTSQQPSREEVGPAAQGGYRSTSNDIQGSSSDTPSTEAGRSTRAISASNPRGRGRVARGIPPPRAGAIRMGMNLSMVRGRGGVRGNALGLGRGLSGIGRGRGALNGVRGARDGAL